MQINIVRPFHPPLESISAELAECLRSGMVTNNSPHVRNFEQKLQDYLSSKLKPVSFCNGEMALFSLIQAWKVKLGYDAHSSFDVLVPSFTFSGTVNAIVANNLKPVFCDIDASLTIDVEKIRAVPENARMIVPVGVYGNLPDLDKIGAFAEKHNLVVVMDNAPAFGSTYLQKHPNHYGFSEIYSFHATKIFSSMEGGAAVVNDQEIYDYCTRLRDFGQYEKSRGDVDVPGLNAKMQEVSALIGLKNLERIGHIISRRKENIAKYRDFFGDLEQKGLLITMRVSEEVFCPYLYFPLILKEEASCFVKHLSDNGIAARRYYTAVHDLKYYKGRYKELDLSFTNAIKDSIVSLPIHTVMEAAELDYLFTTIHDYFK